MTTQQKKRAFRLHPISALAAVGLAIALAGGGVFIFEINRFLQRQAEHELAYNLSRALRLSLQGMQAMETGQRGFLLTGKESYLEPFHSGQALARDALIEFSTLAVNRPELPLAHDLELARREKELELLSTIALKRQGRSSEALRMVDSDEGQDIMDRYVSMVETRLALYRQEQMDLQDQTARRLRSAKLSFVLWFISLSALLGGSLLGSRRSRKRLIALGSRLEREASHDPLTGLPNRRYLNDWLNQSAALSARSDKPMSALYLDLDGFSQINNTLGHAAGDQALTRVSAAFRSQLRDSDFLARVGGDEFVVISSNTSLEEAAPLADRLIRAITEMPPLDGAPVGLLGVSIGVASMPRCAHSASDLLVAADEAMYEAKRAGKRVARFAPAL